MATRRARGPSGATARLVADASWATCAAKWLGGGDRRAGRRRGMTGGGATAGRRARARTRGKGEDERATASLRLGGGWDWGAGSAGG